MKRTDLDRTTHSKEQLPELDSTLTRFLLMDRTVDLLIQKAKTGEIWPDLYERASEVLEALPLATNEFAIAVHRLQNASSYSSQGEYGAASFELRVLRGQLSNCS